jgi:hypothetical protein
VAILVVLGLFLTPMASAGDVTPEYLHGRWVVGESGCNSPDSEFFRFRKDGTFECTRMGETEIVGFWEFNEDILTLHMLTSFAFFEDIHKTMGEYKGQFDYIQYKMIIFNTTQGSFETFGVLGKEIRRASAVRCQ